jgi:hypothetical protein
MVSGGQGGFLAGYAYLFRKCQDIRCNLLPRSSPETLRFVALRKTKSARENFHFCFPTPRDAKDSFSSNPHPKFIFAVTQAVSRLLPFIVNAMVARRLTPEEFGVPTVHFQLLSTVILTSREGFRRALMRDTKATEDISQGTLCTS